MGHRNGPSSDEHRAEFSSPSPQVQPDTRLAYLGTLQLSEVAKVGVQPDPPISSMGFSCAKERCHHGEVEEED